MRFVMTMKTALAALMMVALVACGGGGGAGTALLVEPTTTASDVTITLPSAQVANTVAATIQATVTVVDGNRAALANIPVVLSVDSGATITADATKTDAAGQVKGLVNIGSNTTPRRITVTASAGGVVRTASFDVTSTTAADLSLTLAPSAILSNSGTASVVATITAVDSNRATVIGIPITLSVDNGATIQVSGAVTDASGHVTGTISIGSDKANRTILLTATSGALKITAPIQVTGSKINATVLGSVLSPGDLGSIQYRLVDAGGNPIPDKSITITGPAGVQTVAKTGVSGEYDYAFKAPATAGPLNILASAANVDRTDTIQINSGLISIPAVTAEIRSASVSANPSVVAINTATTSNRTEIRALFLSDSNAPVKDVRVRFDLDGDVQSIGGVLTSGATQVYSDLNGIATAAYVPAGRFSPTDGVTVRACWDKTDFAVTACPNAVRTTLTVIADPLSVSIGTSNTIGTGTSQLTYVTRYVVQVVDSSGLAAKDILVSASVDLLNYYKGNWQLGAERWEQFPTATCANEDLNRNGVAELFSNGVNEDANGSLNLTKGRPALEPRKADVAISFEGSSKTDSSGQVILRIEYPQDVASWVEFNIVVAASGVAGTEGRANYKSILQVPAAFVNVKTATPPFVNSPYGVLASPTIAASVPGSTAAPSMLCTNPY